MTERRGYYNVALFIDGGCPVSKVYSILDALSEEDVDVDYSTVEFQSDGMYMEAMTYREDVVSVVEKIHEEYEWIAIDYDTMSDWENEEAE